ncbi:hypothetical protein DFH06DRAFT_1342522 [Mycena polygramma]|nr:hypothetical protein DFH06DRAFT_1342522 [Mycena polygramma]
MALASYHHNTQASVSAGGIPAYLQPLVDSPLDKAFWGPWYLTCFGMMVRDGERAYDQVELDMKEEGLDQSDSPVWSARSFERMLAYLPCVPHLASKFKRTPGGAMAQKGNIYYIIEGDTKIMKNPVEVGLRHRRIGNEWSSILIAESRERAKELIKEYAHDD